MSYELAINPLQPRPGVPGAPGGGLVPLAPTAAGLPPVDPTPYLSTPPPQFTEAVISIADLLRYLRRSWWLGLLAALPTAALVFYVLGMGTPVYEAEAKLRLRIQDSNPFAFSDIARPGVTELSTPQLINNHLTELKSRKFIDSFFDRFDAEKRARYIEAEATAVGRKDELLKLLGLYKPGKRAADRDIFVGSLESAVRVEPQKESHILRVLVRDRDPRLAADLANSYAAEYIRFYGEQEAGRTLGERDYLQKRAAELKARLEQSEQKLYEYRKTEDLISADDSKDVDGEKVRLLNAAITDAQLRLTKAKNDLQIIRTTQQAGRDLMEVRVVADNPEVAFNRKELDAKIAARRALEPLCGRRHPQMIALAGEIETLKAALDRATGAVVTMAEAEVGNLERQITDYEKQLGTARGQVMSQTGKNVEQKILADQVAADREMYQTIVKKLNQTEITTNFTDTGALSLSDVAAAPEKPVKPNKPVAAVATVMIFGFLFLGLPVGWGLLDDHVLRILRNGGSPSPNIPSVKDVGYSAAAMAGSQTRRLHSGRLPAPAPPVEPPPPSLFKPAAAPHSLVPMAAAQPAILARLPIVGAGKPEAILGQLLRPEPQGAAGALHQLTTTLEMQALKRSGLGGVILVTSADAGEGKTLSAAALAAAFCHQGRSVFMMECNAVSPTLHQWFPRSSTHSSWANDLESLRYGNTNLFLLPAHDLPAYATNELLDGYRAWIERARAQVDWIIMDGGPILRNFADVAPLAPLATDVLLVNSPEISNATKLRAALNLLQPMMSSSAFRGMIVQGNAPV